ncbi:MAG: MFS transporter [Gammaproteobacteria bacterium]|nr:MFS transporter [Gammaproteobacteria bacterium]
MVANASVPYWRLSMFYLFFFASIGAFVPYWTLYLKSLGFSPAEIGELMAITLATKIVAPNVWGWLADHSGRRMLIVRVGTFCALVAFSAVFIGQSYGWMALVMCVFSFFWNAVLPQFEATTMRHLGAHSHGYSAIRLWGSIGFIAAVMALGPALDKFDTGLLPQVILPMLLAIFLASLWVPEERESPIAHHHGSILLVLRQPPVLALLGVCFLMQLSHGPYYTFFTIYLEDHGYSRSLIGQLWGLGVMAEIVVFLFMARLMPRLGARRLMIGSLGLASLRWVLIALFPDQLAIILFAQVLHAASFGVCHAVAIHLIHRLFVGRFQGRGQALYSSLSFGAGGAVGSFGSGYVWSHSGPAVMFLIAAGVSAVACVVAWRYLTEPGHED